ncbi:hypothetical protein BKP45_09320 [Anaerobacillus alkalidiazotrophicus]|uniref:Uncharacterized protein n=1 Tax=Anaerobacillus alkalidiazotrophicus TaxID=472963 RepID=A0A1S2M668_9BACI|nr:hypothetical protein [Anaerobacillus alkalidiazotrophicus]OIJ20258.1 hypothetical protein BKP45_09320 [Anaerobacillus alkalidiazotrophicus]
MKYLVVIFIIIGIIFSTSNFFHSTNNTNDLSKEAIVNSPIDQKKQFSKVSTTLKLMEQDDEDEYTIEWQTSSEIADKTYLSQDISLLFEDGWLKETMSVVKENSHILQQKQKINGEDSGHFEAVTFHYGQTHYPNDVIKSIQSMSYDELYILDSPLSPIEYFKTPTTPSEIEGKRILDTIIQQNLEYTWQELIEYFNIPLSNYYSVPLTELYKYYQQPLPKLTGEETKEMLALTWSAIYKYYFLGIEKHNGTIVSPVDSSVPLILFNKSYSHILIIFTSKDGEKYNIIKNTGRF